MRCQHIAIHNINPDVQVIVIPCIPTRSVYTKSNDYVFINPRVLLQVYEHIASVSAYNL